MQNLIPKAIRRTRLEFFRGISIIEFILAVAWIILAAAIFLTLPLQWYIRIPIFIFGSFLVTPLILPMMGHLRGWEVILLWVKYLVAPKKYQAKTKDDTSLLVPYDCAVKEHFLKTQLLGDYAYYVAGFEIKGFNLSLLNLETQILKIQDLQDTFKYCDFPITMMKIDLPINFSATISYYQDQLKQYQSDSPRYNQLQAQINHLQSQTINSDNVVKTRKAFFFFVYGTSITEIENYCQQVANKLQHNGFGCDQLTNYQLVNVINTIYNPYAKPITTAQFNRHKNHLETLLSFKQFTVAKDYLIADKLYYGISIHDYPFEPRSGWGAYLASNEQTIIWNIYPLSHKTIKKALDKAINNSKVKHYRTKSNMTNKEVEYQINAYEALSDNIAGGNEVVKNVNLLFLSYGTDLNTLNEARARLKNALKLDMTENPLAYRQLLGFSAILPKPNDPLIFKNGREMPCWTLASSFPLLNGGLTDKKGLYLGDNTTNDAMFFDQFLINDKRKNHNQIIIGTSGSGKSTLTKKAIAFHLNMNRTVIVIDSEREYRNLCNYYQGQWIDTGNATIGRINPLQVLDNNFREADEVTSENFDEANEAPVSNHLRLLTQWFKMLYHDLKEKELRVLINEIQKTYTKFNIANDTNISQLTVKQFPTFQDLYQTIKQSYQAKPSKTLSEILDIIQYDFCHDGQYSKLWNGHTTLNFKNQFVVYDVWTLFNQDIPKITAANYI